jgi:gamma-glutamyltranspeptidase/glutathione hydrolase
MRLSALRLPLAAALMTTLALAVALAGADAAQTNPQRDAPPPAKPAQAKPGGHVGGMVSAANPMAVEAGLKVLRAGGDAMDAAVAVQATLGLVEPQSSGLGGGAFMTYYDAKTKQVTAYDGRETAPAGATPTMFLGSDGKPLPFGTAVASGRSTGAPGAIAMLSMAHADHGKLAWKDLFGEAERLARDGFPIPGRMAAEGSRDSRPDIKAYLGGKKAGDILTNVAYADTVHALALQGPSALLQGKVAADIAARVHQDPIPGSLTVADISGYKPHKSEALCRPYRVYIVCVPPAPSGGPGVLMALGIFGNTEIAKDGPNNERSWFIFAEGQRLMYADRDKYVGDPAFVSVPTAGLLDPAYLKGRAALIGEKAVPRLPGNPPGAPVRGPDATREPGGTSHFVVVDGAGNAVSMTTTVEGPFGSGRMVDGFVLNNQLTDFSFSPTEQDGSPAANAVAAGKRPRSSMAPVIILDKNRKLVAAFGSPGGNAIPAYNLKALVGFVDWNMPLQEAFNLPNLIARGPVTQAETDKFAPGIVQALTARGLNLRGGGAEGSGLHGVFVKDGKLDGAADVRREGVALAP